MEPNFESHRTEYQRLASTSRRREHRSHAVPTISCGSTCGSARGSAQGSARGRPNTGGSEVSWKFTGKPFTEGISNREAELKEGCGIFPRVHPDDDPRIAEVPVTCRRDIQFATTALAAHGGIIPRMPKVEEAIAKHKRHPTTWHEHCHLTSNAASKQVRPLRVAGLSGARLGYISQPPSARCGVEDRPTWMRAELDLPGGYLYCPSDANSLLPEGARGRGDTTRFGRDAHFTSQFTPRVNG